MTTTAADLLGAIDDGDDAALDRLLADLPSLAGSRDGDGVSAVLHALYRNRRAAATAIAAVLPSLDVFEAAALGRDAAVAELLGTDPSLARTWSPDGFTPLHLAAFFGGGALVSRALLEAGADPNAGSRNAFAVMPLHSAAAGGHADVVGELLAAGADPSARQRHGWVPLHAAAEHGDDAMVDALLAAGADARAATDDGRTPAEMARAAGHQALADRLSR